MTLLVLDRAVEPIDVSKIACVSLNTRDAAANRRDG